MHIAVIGAGVFGTWTALFLRAAGARVTLVDAYGPGNSRSSSGDESRIVRCGYGPDEIYSRFALRSLELWRDLAGRLPPEEPTIWHPCGVLWIGSGDDPYIHATRQTLERGPYALEVLDAEALATRYPHVQTGDVGLALLEPEGGVIMARRAVRAVAAALVRRGVHVERGRAIVLPARGPLESIRLARGGELAADRFVFACGAWLPQIFPELLRGRIRSTRQVVIYFGTPPGDDRFAASHTPAWVDFAAGIYGVPELEARGMKVGIDSHGPEIDPDTHERTLDAESVARARAWLARRFPAMADAPVVESRVCQYENTSTGDFLIDRHPDHDNVWIAGGGSGHGFKHGPAVGEYVSELITAARTPEPRFALAGKEAVARRAIY